MAFRYARQPSCSFMESAGESSITLKKTFDENGLQPRIHGNSKRTPHHALSFEATKSAVKFLIEYSEQNAIILPG